MTNLKLSDELALPIDAATQTFAFIGRKGSGKTYGAGKLCELLIGAGVQVIILDLVGKWWGLRLSADGKTPGIDIPMFGGLRGDIPLEATGGALISDALHESGRSAILDISQFSKGDRQRFAFQFGEQLWKQKKSELNPTPVHLVIEESQLIVPENIAAGGSKGDFLAQMYGMYEEIIRLGRNYGIGVTMITQRPQSVAKEVLNQAEPLLVFQLIGSHERKAVSAWIKHQGMDEGLVDSLPSLGKGECWFWSPEWLTKLEQIKIAPKWTFDSTATPKVGDKSPKARTIKALDLGDLQLKMAATIERAKENDPKELKRRIAELERAAKSIAPAKVETHTVEKLIVTDAQVKRVEGVASRLEAEGQRRLAAADSLAESGRELIATAREFTAAISKATNVPPPRPAAKPHPTAFRGVSAPRVMPDRSKAEGDLPKGERATLIACAQYPEGLQREQLTVLTGYKRSSRDAYIQRLREKGHLVDASGKICATDAGVAALGDFDPLPTGEALRDYWMARLPEGEKVMLGMLIEAYPNAVAREQLSEASGYQRSSRDAYLQRMKAKQLIVTLGRGEVKASDNLFE